jgi:hypothetical protein
MDPDLDNEVPSSPIADTDPLGYPFAGPHRHSLLAPPPIRSSSPTIIFRAKRKRVPGTFIYYSIVFWFLTLFLRLIHSGNEETSFQ